MAEYPHKGYNDGKVRTDRGVQRRKACNNCKGTARDRYNSTGWAGLLGCLGGWPRLAGLVAGLLSSWLAALAGRAGLGWLEAIPLMSWCVEKSK